jgi:hypothetical protein
MEDHIILVTMKREEFNAIKKDQLGWKIIEPLLIKIRGKDIATKADAYKELNEGQRALFVFFAFHNHAHTIGEFYWMAAYNIGIVKLWPALKTDISYLGSNEMQSIYEEIEAIFEANNRQDDGSWRDAMVSDLDKDSELLTSINEIYSKYCHAAERTINLMNIYVANNLGEFVCYEG